MTEFLHTLFHWPDGIVVGNLLASFLWIPFDLVVAYLLRHQIMKRFVALHHHHSEEHKKRLQEGR